MPAGTYLVVADILGGADTVDEWGDPVEGVQVLGPPVPVTITEARQVVATESDPQAVVIHYYIGRVPAGTAVMKDYRLRVPAGDVNGQLYMIDHVRDTPGSLVDQDDIRLDLRRVS